MDPIHMGVVTETSKQVTSFQAILKNQPLSLALVVMNFVLLGFLFYSGSSTLSQRKETAELIIKWQQDTDRLMASCVSSDIMQMVLNALERTQRFDDKSPSPLVPLPPLSKERPPPIPEPK